MYTLSYYHNGDNFIDTDETLDHLAVQQLLDVALKLKMCDVVILQCIHDGDVLYTNEFFLCGENWYVVLDNAHTDSRRLFTINILGKGKVN